MSELLLLVQLRLVDAGPPFRTRKLQLPVLHFRPPGFELDGMDSPSPAVIVDQVAVPGYLHQEGFPLNDLSLAVVELIDEVDVAFLVDIDVPINQIWHRHGDRTATRALRDHVDKFLRKRVEHDAPGALA